MTDRERMLAAIRGEAPDRIPWVPRLDFWYRARRRNGTLPEHLRDLNLIEIADRLGAGCYSVIPDFTAGPDELDMIDQALGIFRLPVLPYRVTLDGVERRILERGRRTVIEYHTPVGSVRTATLFTDEMLDAGASVPWIAEHAIRELKDFETVGYIFEHARVEPQLEGYLDMRRQVGDRGLVIGYVSGSACPLHHILKTLIPFEEFFYALHDDPRIVEGLSERMAPFYRKIRDCAAASPAEVVLLGGNYDDTFTPPPFFRRYILPHLAEFAGELHARGKFLMTHTDGESRRLLPLYLEAGFDVADSVCPHPMTSLHLDEFLEGLSGHITVMGGIPAVLLCAGSASYEDCRRFIDDVLERHGRRTRFILGVSDMVTADAEWDRLRHISERVGEL